MKFQFQIKAPPSLARLRLLSVLPVRLRRLNPHRLGGIFDLKIIFREKPRSLPEMSFLIVETHLSRRR